MIYRTRAQWGATFDISQREKMSLPVALLFIHHNVIEPTNNPNVDMNQTEQVDIARFGSPSYKWAIHPSGVVLEGMGAHSSPDTLNHNSDSISIMFMGNFEVDRPTGSAIFAGRELVELLRAFNFLTKDFRIYGHRDVFATACPGKNLYPRIGELIVPPPTKNNTPISIEREDNMALEDPTTGGVWVVKPDGAVFAYDGAPALGGTNNDKMNPTKAPCVGITRFHSNVGEGYCLVLQYPPTQGADEFRRFRFPRDGSAKV